MVPILQSLISSKVNEAVNRPWWLCRICLMRDRPYCAVLICVCIPLPSVEKHFIVVHNNFDADRTDVLWSEGSSKRKQKWSKSSRAPDLTDKWISFEGQFYWKKKQKKKRFKDKYFSRSLGNSEMVLLSADMFLNPSILSSLLEMMVCWTWVLLQSFVTTLYLNYWITWQMANF